MNDSSEDENQPCSSKKTQNYRKTKNVPSVRWSTLLEDNAFHNPNDEHLIFSGIAGRVRNTPQDQETLSYSMLFLTDKIIEDIVLEPNRYQNQVHNYNSREHANPL